MSAELFPAPHGDLDSVVKLEEPSIKESLPLLAVGTALGPGIGGQCSQWTDSAAWRDVENNSLMALQLWTF